MITEIKRDLFCGTIASQIKPLIEQESVSSLMPMSEGDFAVLDAIGSITAKDYEILQVLNAKTQRGPVPISELTPIFILNNIIPICELIAEDESKPLEQRILGKKVLCLFKADYRLETVNVDIDAVQQGLTAFVALGYITEEQKAAITAMGNNRLSYAEKNYGRNLEIDDILKAFGRYHK